MPRDAHSAAKAVDMLDLLIEFFEDEGMEREAAEFRRPARSRDRTLQDLLAPQPA
jgi:hypothetical protein